MGCAEKHTPFSFPFSKRWPKLKHKRKKILLFRSFWTTCKIALVPGTEALKAFPITINCLWLCILWLFMYSNNTVKTGNIIEIWPNYGQGISVSFHCLLNRNAANKKGVRMHTFKTTHPQRHSPHSRRIRLTTTLHTCRTLSRSYVRSRSSFVGR